MPPMASDEYEVPRPGKIRLKETRSEKAERVYRREQKRMLKEQLRINRANGYACSPPRRGREEESMSPPRRPAKRSWEEEPEGEAEQGGAGGSRGYRWMGGMGAAAMDARRMMDQQERFTWAAMEDMHRASDDFYGVSWGFAQPTPDTNIPLRYRQASDSRTERRDAAREVELDGGPVPDIGHMTENEYAEWVREGMYRLKHKDELDEMERRKRDQLRQERERVLEEERKAKEERRRRKREERDKAGQQPDVIVIEEDREVNKAEIRERYQARWKAITDTGGDIVETEITYHDIPWPTYSVLDKDAVLEFMSGLAEDNKEELKRTLREAIRVFHPDRFFGRLLPRVREEWREKVKEGVEKCSRIINDLASGL